MKKARKKLPKAIQTSTNLLGEAIRTAGISARELGSSMRELGNTLPAFRPDDNISGHHVRLAADVRFNHAMSEEGLKTLIDEVADNPNAMIPLSDNQRIEYNHGVPANSSLFGNNWQSHRHIVNTDPSNSRLLTYTFEGDVRHGMRNGDVGGIFRFEGREIRIAEINYDARTNATIIRGIHIDSTENNEREHRSNQPPAIANNGDTWTDNNGNTFVRFEGSWMPSQFSPQGESQNHDSERTRFDFVGYRNFHIGQTIEIRGRRRMIQNINYNEGDNTTEIIATPINPSVNNTIAEPENPSDGDIWMNQGDNSLYVWSGGQWQAHVVVSEGGVSELEFPAGLYNNENIHIGNIISLGFNNIFEVVGVDFNGSGDATSTRVRPQRAEPPIEANDPPFTAFFAGDSGNDPAPISNPDPPNTDELFKPEMYLTKEKEKYTIKIIKELEGKVGISAKVYKRIATVINEVSKPNIVKQVVDIILLEQTKKPKSNKRRIRL